MIQTVDLNSDIGELTDNDSDAIILSHVSSVNISCGVHAGSADLTRRTITAALAANVSIGAHPGLPGSFGRSDDPVDGRTAYATIVEQLVRFLADADNVGAEVRHVKPHGALYNQGEVDQDVAESIVAAVRAVAPSLPLYCLANGRVASAAAAAGLRCLEEFFADRAYDVDGKLVQRRKAGALIEDSDEIIDRTLRAIQTGFMTTIEGLSMPVRFDSICVHGDTPGAAKTAVELRRALENAGIAIVRPD